MSSQVVFFTNRQAGLFSEDNVEKVSRRLFGPVPLSASVLPHEL